MRHRTFTRITLFAGIGLLWMAPGRIFSQASTATMQGTVRDASGAVVPGATITVTNVQTRVSSSWTTSAEGEYIAPFLLPGEYEVTAEKQGFKKAVRKGITLLIADKARADMDLAVGAISEVVTATAEAPLVKSDTSEISQVIGARPITELPLSTSTGRNFTALMTLVPGAIRTNPVGVFDAPQGNSSFAVNGQRDSANNYMIDGADNNEVLLGIVTVLPPPEAIGEFKIQTNVFSAEYGRAGGAVVNVQTRAGTNRYTGSLYEFVRNSAWDARGPFDGATLPPLRQNEFGGTLGGPIRKNRTFFFGDYVGFHQRAGQTFTASVPTLNQRNGVFLASEGAGAIYNPFARQPFGVNTIPASSINTTGQKIARLYPEPTQTGTVSTNSTGVANNYRGVSVQQQDTTRVDLRIDHTLTSKNTLYGRYSIFDAFTALPPLFGATATGSVPGRAGRGDSRDQSIVLSDVHIFSGSKINEFRASYSRIANSFVGYDYGRSLAQELGIANINIFGAISSGLPRITVENSGTLGVDAPIPALRYENSFQYVDNFTWIQGRHSLKFGGDLRRFRGDFFQISLDSPRGTFGFDRNYTSNAGAANTGLGVASLLLGYPAAISRGIINDFPSNRITQTFFFVQDDMKVSRKLTLNIGLRYELYFPVVDRYDNQSNFNLQTAQVLLAGRGSNSRSLVNLDKNNWAPRFGFAYMLRPKTVVRGGYGISYYPDKFGATGGTLNTNYPFITLQSVTPADRFAPTPSLLINNGITPPPPAELSKPSIPLIGDILVFDQNYKLADIQFWNLAIQHQFGASFVLETAYVATKGTHLFGNNHVNLNQPDPGPGNVATRRPYAVVAPLAVNLRLRDSSQASIYHALQVRAEKRMTGGLWWLNSYVWSKSIDDAAAALDPRNWHLGTRGPSNNDFRHNWTSSALYEIPAGKGRKFMTSMHPVTEAIVGGWQINGIYTFRTGLPSTPSLSAALVAQTLNNSGSNRPDLAGNPELPKSERTIDRYFNTTVLIAPATNSFRFGNAGRNTIRGPSFSSLDMSLFKSFQILERMKLQLRAESFNIPNHPNYGNPNTQVGANTIGQIRSLTGNVRQTQFGLKLLF